MRILVVEDEEKFGIHLKEQLEKERYAVDIEHDGERGLYRAKTNDYDLIVLDDILPGKAGSEICKELRRKGKTVPILLMSVQSGVDKKVGLLNDGADDYITKPFAFPEVSARVRALLRRPQQLEDEKICIDDLVIVPGSFSVVRADRAIYLTAKEFSLLHYLARHRGRVVSRAMILEHVWDAEGNPLSNTIEAHILNLRRKIHTKGLGKLIYTVPGRGYSLRGKEDEEPLYK